VHDQDLCAPGGGAADRLGDRSGLVEGRNHHRDAHGSEASTGAREGGGGACYPSRVNAPPADPPEQRPPLASAPRYAAAGVDLDRDEGFVEQIKEIARPTLRPEILSSIGGFAGTFKAPDRYKDPVFVASTDGVGTKLRLATQLGRIDTVGIDCVAMVVNDLVVQGAEPIVFLDYLAMGSLDPELARQALRGIAEGCRRAGCALLGGETASMPGFYGKGDLEMVGFGVGVVERDGLIDGSSISQGDAILGLASSGVHSNGYSLVREIVDAGVKAGQLDLRGENDELNTSLGGALLAPTRIYVKAILNLRRDFNLKGLVHITGGGFVGNVPPVLPQGGRPAVGPSAWLGPRPALFARRQAVGEIGEGEMLGVLTCGIGMLLIAPRGEATEARERLQALGERCSRVGEVEAKAPDDPPLLLGPLKRRA